MPETCGTCLSYSEVDGFPGHLLGLCKKRNKYVAYYAVCWSEDWRPKQE